MVKIAKKQYLGNKNWIKLILKAMRRRITSQETPQLFILMEDTHLLEEHALVLNLRVLNFSCLRNCTMNRTCQCAIQHWTHSGNIRPISRRIIGETHSWGEHLVLLAPMGLLHRPQMARRASSWISPRWNIHSLGLKCYNEAALWVWHNLSRILKRLNRVSSITIVKLSTLQEGVLNRCSAWSRR